MAFQGTAATALAGVYGALKVQGKPAHSLTQQRIVVLGAGSAGMGVSTMMAQGMVKHVSWSHDNGYSHDVVDITMVLQFWYHGHNHNTGNNNNQCLVALIGSNNDQCSIDCCYYYQYHYH